MADSKISSLTAATTAAAADQVALVQGGVSKSATLSVLRAAYIGAGLSNASTSTVSAGYAVDTYLAGSSITIPTAGGWRIGTQYRCRFDMIKTAASTAAATITFRMGTAGTIADTAITVHTWGAGTAAADTGIFEVVVTFRVVGASSVVSYQLGCIHHLAATGLISTGASGTGILTAVSGSFDTTTYTVAGLSFNGGASFSGTNTQVATSLLGG